jgi:UDP-glucose 4-epimerase
MTRVLITGGAGFIGSHLAERLLAIGYEVFVIDDLSTGSIRNIAHLKISDRFHYAIDTVMNRPLLAELVDAADVVYHLAAAVGVRLVVESPVRTIETNVGATEVVLAAAAKKRRPIFIASTSEVYGNSPDIPFAENGNLVLGAPTAGRWSYACSKAIDEFLALAYFRERHLPVVVGRLFNTVGPRQTGRYGMVLPTFMRQALAGEPITVYGDGQQTRCFCHVQDTVAALMLLMNPPSPSAGDLHSRSWPSAPVFGQIFNIGSDVEILIRELAVMVRDVAMETSGQKSPIELVPYEKAYPSGFEDMRRRVPDVRKIEAQTGWRAQIGLGRILRDVRDHLRGT